MNVFCRIFVLCLAGRLSFLFSAFLSEILISFFSVFLFAPSFVVKILFLFFFSFFKSIYVFLFLPLFFLSFFLPHRVASAHPSPRRASAGVGGEANHTKGKQKVRYENRQATTTTMRRPAPCSSRAGSEVHPPSIESSFAPLDTSIRIPPPIRTIHAMFLSLSFPCSFPVLFFVLSSSILLIAGFSCTYHCFSALIAFFVFFIFVSWFRFVMGVHTWIGLELD